MDIISVINLRVFNFEYLIMYLDDVSLCNRRILKIWSWVCFVIKLCSSICKFYGTEAESRGFMVYSKHYGLSGNYL